MVSFGNLYNTHVVPLATMYFLSFCRFFGKAKDYLLRIYATSEIVRLLTDKSYITTLRVYHFLIAQKTEPDVIPWISTAWVAEEEVHIMILHSKVQKPNSYPLNIRTPIYPLRLVSRWIDRGFLLETRYSILHLFCECSNTSLKCISSTMIML